MCAANAVINSVSHEQFTMSDIKKMLLVDMVIMRHGLNTCLMACIFIILTLIALSPFLDWWRAYLG